jgi:hypothetical protein
MRALLWRQDGLVATEIRWPLPGAYVRTTGRRDGTDVDEAYFLRTWEIHGKRAPYYVPTAGISRRQQSRLDEEIENQLDLKDCWVAGNLHERASLRLYHVSGGAFWCRSCSASGQELFLRGRSEIEAHVALHWLTRPELYREGLLEELNWRQTGA